MQGFFSFLKTDPLKFYKNLNPDTALNKFGDASKFTTFVYSTTNTLFCQSGKKKHGQGLRDSLQPLMDEPNDARFIFGRFGKTKAGGFVTIWRVGQGRQTIDGQDERGNFTRRYGFNIGTQDDLKRMLNAMVQGTAKVVGDSPAQYPITPDYIFTNAEGTITYIKDLSLNDDCIKFINVNGKDISLGTALGNLHMVRGEELEQTKIAICSNYDRLKRELEQEGCDTSVLEELKSRVKCTYQWDKLKQQGKRQYKDELRRIFSKPEELDSIFRGRQDDINKAWDYFNKESFGYYCLIRDLSEAKYFS